MQNDKKFNSEMDKRIIKKRKQLGLSQEELAARADVSPRILLKISSALGLKMGLLQNSSFQKKHK